jgi:type VI secretion system protein ImpG
LLSANALNHIGLAHAPHGREALQELLRLCDYSSSETPRLADVVQQNIDGIKDVRSRGVQSRVSSGKNLGYCRGLEIEVELDNRHYGNVGVLLFASVLERFFSLYAGVNSFVQLVLKTTQSKDPVKKWPPRTAEHLLQ